eukprot:m.43302 g.43302  ORF g.43302 m.43302 type:complete len:74 (+) comp6383_c1_seq1:9-230(+)
MYVKYILFYQLVLSGHCMLAEGCCRLQTMSKSDLHVSFSTIAADGWENNASFREQAWRLARFFDRLVQGSIMS